MPQTIWFSADNIRSMQSVIAAMWWNEEQRWKHNEFLKNGRIKTMEELSYVQVNDDDFSRWLLDSIKERKVMRRTIKNSDMLMQELWYKQSSFSVMAQDVAKILLRYYNALKTRNNINKEYEDRNLYRIFCGKEFIYASFRAKIIELLYWNQSQEAYIDWYESAMENKRSTRTEIWKIVVQECRWVIKFKIEDSYWEDIVDREALGAILHEKNLTFNS